MRKMNMLLALLFAVLLAGCCYDDKGNLVSYGDCPVVIVDTIPNATFKCNGASCGNALSAYSGTDVNVWSYKNDYTTSAALSVSIANIPNKEVTVVYTNEGTTSVNLPSIPVDTTLKSDLYNGEYREKFYEFKEPDFMGDNLPELININNLNPNQISQLKAWLAKNPLYNNYSLVNSLSTLSEEDTEEFYEFREPDFMMDNPPELIESDDFSTSQTPPLKAWSVGNPRTWKVHSDYSPINRQTTLKKQLTVGGRTINIWVEDSEYANGRMNDAKINYIASNVGTVYANVVKAAGEPWGARKASNLISGDQPLDIVFFNSGGSIGGYYWSRNSYTGYSSTSNEAVVVFVCTVGTGGSEKFMLSTIAHEITHAINFYQRYVLMGSSNDYETFLEEMTAVMMEDVVAGQISYNYTMYGYINWLNIPLYHCDFTNWGGCSGSSYSVAGSFGSFLLRQYGIDFYKTLLRTSGSSTDALDKAIKVYDSGGLKKALRNWGASIAMFPAAASPKGFGYPARFNDNGFNLSAFDGNTYRRYRKLPTYSPSTLAPNAHFPFLRKATGDVYNDSFIVPKGVSVSIVVK
ncbi:MAG: hypothetical protein LBT96_00335 [Campylobacteraceae bacterium]|jgi:outer membrane murein-binding lipoprotein Lpp|nr:hypothetical protein [Campylobacteraceae bacterium]